jgi:hypothetical protein
MLATVVIRQRRSDRNRTDVAVDAVDAVAARRRRTGWLKRRVTQTVDWCSE